MDLGNVFSHRLQIRLITLSPQKPYAAEQVGLR